MRSIAGEENKIAITLEQLVEDMSNTLHPERAASKTPVKLEGSMINMIIASLLHPAHHPEKSLKCD
jgi:hypothetical protein